MPPAWRGVYPARGGRAPGRSAGNAAASRAGHRPSGHGNGPSPRTVAAWTRRPSRSCPA